MYKKYCGGKVGKRAHGRVWEKQLKNGTLACGGEKQKAYGRVWEQKLKKGTWAGVGKKIK